MKKRPLTDEERTLLVDYRIQREKETLSEADNLIEAGFFNAAVNRLYYACYDNEMIDALRPQAEEFISVIEKEMKN